VEQNALTINELSGVWKSLCLMYQFMATSPKVTPADGERYMPPTSSAGQAINRVCAVLNQFWSSLSVSNTNKDQGQRYNRTGSRHNAKSPTTRIRITGLSARLLEHLRET